MKLKNFLVVDTDTSWIPKFRRRLSVLGIEDQFAVEEIFPDASLPDRELIDGCLEGIAKFIEEGNVAAVFVDIVIKEEGDLDALGIIIAREFRARWSTIPIFNVTGKILEDQGQELFSEATLEDVDGVLAKTFLYGSGASVARFRQILRGRKRIGIGTETPALNAALSTSKGAAAREAFGEKHLEPRIKALINELGPAEFWGLLGELLPQAEGALSIINPGRSGAIVIRAMARFTEKGRSSTLPTSWIVKIGADLDLMRREVEGYKSLSKTPLARDRYPRLLHGDLKIVGRLGGMAVEWEGEAATLLEFMAGGPRPEDVQKVGEGVVRNLEALYGEPVASLGRPWGKFYQVNEGLEVKLLGFLDEVRPLLDRFADQQATRRLESFIISNGRTERSIAEFQCDSKTVHLHGDLNSRNMLVAKDGRIVFIDFASRRQGHAAFDFAKLERDLLLRVADWNTADFYDFASLDRWSKLLFVDGLENASAWVDGLDERGRPIGVLIKSLREAASRYGASRQQYLIALIFFMLLGLLHPEISVAKKVFTVRSLASLIDSLS